MKAEVAAREARIDVLHTTLERAENKEWEDLIGFETKLPPLPKRPAHKRDRRVPIVPRPTTAGGRKWKRSCSHPPVSGGQRPAIGRTNAVTRTRSLSRPRDRADRSRTHYREYPPRASSTARRGRSSSQPPAEASVLQEVDEHHSLGRVSRVSAKKGRLSDLLYDTIQERTIELQKEDDPPRTVREDDPPHTVRCIQDTPEDQDDEHRYIQDLLDDQALDLDANYEDYRILDSD